MHCGFKLKNYFSIASQGRLREKILVYALKPPWNDSIWWRHWLCSMPRPREWLCKSLAYVDRLTRIGGAALATSRWDCVGFRALCIKGGNSCARLRYSQKTHNLVLPRIGLNEIFMTRFGLLEVVPLSASLDLPVIY
jgi:hypothetical protein